MSNKKAINNFFIPLLKLKGVIKSDGTLNTDKSNTSIKSVKLNSKPKKSKTETSTVSKNNNTKKSKTETSTVSKNNNTKKGISASILNQSNLLKKKFKIKKKTLLGE